MNQYDSSIITMTQFPTEETMLQEIRSEEVPLLEAEINYQLDGGGTEKERVLILWGPSILGPGTGKPTVVWYITRSGGLRVSPTFDLDLHFTGRCVTFPAVTFNTWKDEKDAVL